MLCTARANKKMTDAGVSSMTEAATSSRKPLAAIGDRRENRRISGRRSRDRPNPIGTHDALCRLRQAGLLDGARRAIIGEPFVAAAEL